MKKILLILIILFFCLFEISSQYLSKMTISSLDLDNIPINICKDGKLGIIVFYSAIKNLEFEAISPSTGGNTIVNLDYKSSDNCYILCVLPQKEKNYSVKISAYNFYPETYEVGSIGAKEKKIFIINPEDNKIEITVLDKDGKPLENSLLEIIGKPIERTNSDGFSKIELTNSEPTTLFISHDLYEEKKAINIKSGNKYTLQLFRIKPIITAIKDEWEVEFESLKDEITKLKGENNEIIDLKEKNDIPENKNLEKEIVKKDEIIINRSNNRNGDVLNPDGIELVYVEGLNIGGMVSKGFYIGKYEITQAQWRAVMYGNPSKWKGDNLPVENVSWNSVKQFITILSESTGNNYRLPTEAEWEYAARGGNSSSEYKYSGSNNIENVAWYNGNSGKRTNPVGTKAPNELGIFDMSGNVWEWCQDCNGLGCVNRVVRGGAWNCNTSYCRVVGRYSWNESETLNNVGFRVILTDINPSDKKMNNPSGKELVFVFKGVEKKTNSVVKLYLDDQFIGETYLNKGFKFNYLDMKPGIHKLDVVWSDFKWNGSIVTNAKTEYIFEYKNEKTGFGYKSSFELVE